ncbi:MAG: pilus assembly protein PilP [Deltaproteobacteria bacterium]|nr:pilus assembly protein PilP [Deltaproteobacteria bacterium]
MQHLPRKRGKSKDSLISLLAIFIFMNFGTAMASQEVIYKETRPLKKVFEDQKKPEKDESEQKATGFFYDPTGKTDPFKSFIAKREEVAKKKKVKPRTYLETVDLSQLDLILILIGPEGKRAMVRDSKGIGHVIKEGTDIGTNGGVVIKIKEGEVVIREEYKDFRGRTQHKDIVKKSSNPD